jgi:hypothetical protein
MAMPHSCDFFKLFPKFHFPIINILIKMIRICYNFDLDKSEKIYYIYLIQFVNHWLEAQLITIKLNQSLL